MLVGCALTTPAPAGPLRPGDATQIETAWAFAYGRASATVNGAVVTGNGQAQVEGRPAKGDPIPTLPDPVPLTVGVRQVLRGSLEASGDLGWMDSGVGLRGRVPYLDREALPLVVGAGLRTGKISAFASDTYEGSLAIETYPRIAPLRYPSWRLILSLGVTGGIFQHQLLLPEAYDSDSDAPQGPPTVVVLRRELRLQTAVGVYLGGERRGLAITLAPWILLGASAPNSIKCGACNGVTSIANFSQTWGLALVVAPSYAWAHGG